MSAQAFIHSTIQLARFREQVALACRNSGHLQRELAGVLGIDPKVLSRKLHGAKQAYPSHLEVKRIILVLAEWDAITTQLEAIQLLTLMGLRTGSFTPEEWASDPLNRLQLRPDLSSAPPSGQLHPKPLQAPSTPLIGRETQIEHILASLENPSIRLLTLLGTGGIGKTRLALEIAHASQSKFADGVGWLSLAATYDVTLVPAAIVQALGLQEPITIGDPGQRSIFSPEDQLITALQGREFLLVLDNVEHLPEIRYFINDLLTKVATLKILVTSRVVLHLSGEHIFKVPPLATGAPDDTLLDPETVEQIAAIRLFVDRAQALDPTFRLSAQTVEAVAQICARLDGLPLAIELAAGRTKVLPLPLILERLTDEAAQPLTFLRTTHYDVPRRHQTLQETLDWSYALLDPVHRRLFRSLSIFTGSWTLQAVRHVCQGENKVSEDELLEQLETLIDHSLVQRTPLDDDASKALRFHLLETIRDYGKGWLDASGEREDLQRRHAIYYLKQAQQLEVPLSSRKLLAIVFKLSYDQANLRTALSWFVEHHEAELAQQMCAALGRYWEAGSNFQEARHWMDLALAMPEETPPTTRARLLKAVARITQWEMDWERSLACAREALTLYEATNDDAGKAWALFHIGDVSHMQGHYRVAINYFEESLYLFQVQEDWVSYAFTLSRLGATATMLGSYDQAELWLKEALAQHRVLRKQGWLTLTVISLGVVAILQGNLAQSTVYLKEGLWLAQQTGNRYMLALDLIVFGCLIGTSSGPVYAARICSGAEELFAQIKTMLPPSYHLIYHTHLLGLKAQVDAATWDKWWAEGKLLSADELIELALKMTEEEDSR